MKGKNLGNLIMFVFKNFDLIFEYSLTFISEAILIALIFNLCVCIAIQLIHFITILRPNYFIKSPDKGNIGHQSFISIHIATYNEPKDIVIATLNSICSLKYKNYEVIVLDNNTQCKSVYKPVEEHCKFLNQQTVSLKFKFYHFDNVKGAKAGALNIALKCTDSRAEHVAIIDADYCVEPHFLSLAADCLSDNKVSFVQFPQAYRGSSLQTAAVEEELADYFEAFARRASEDSAVLLTGTLSVIRLKDLQAVGGWSGNTVTEDAELGARLFMNGHSGVFMPHIAGRGLLPLSFDSLRKQRDRWVVGNIQTLITTLKMIGKNGWRKGALSVIAQLTAWPAFWLIPTFCLIMARFLPKNHELTNSIIFLSATTILLSAVAVSARLILCAYIKKQSFNHIPSALMVKLALVWTSSTAFIPALLGQSVGFVRTSKSLNTAKNTPSNTVFHKNWLLAMAVATGFAFYAFNGHWLASIACLLIFSSIPAAWRVEHCLIEYSKTATNS